MDRLQKVVTLATRMTFAANFFAGAFVVVFGGWVLGLFGQPFIVALPCLYIFIFGHVVSAMAGSVGLLLSMTGHHNEVALVTGISVVLNVALNLLLVPHYGIEGAAAATAISLVCWNIVLVFRARKLLGINTVLH